MLSHPQAAHAAHTPWLNGLRATWGTLARIASRSWRNSVTRRELAGLDDRMLADIGLTRGAALLEADRFPWDAAPRRRRQPPPTGPGIGQRLDVMWQRHCSRRRIAQLDGEMLKDIGVSYAEAEAEANKPFWRA